MSLHQVMDCERVESVGKYYQQGVLSERLTLEKCRLPLRRLSHGAVLGGDAHGVKIVGSEERD